MSDQAATPPKPKVGSLRDRIAAFEKSATAAAPVPAPAPRPKPAGFASWKPKAPSPPSSPSATATTTTDHASSSTAKAGGMSASDAKESITKAGSLKDRMAALQGKGAFGAPPPVAPKPVAEKPKWKPPPVVQAPVDDDDHTTEPPPIAAAVERTLSPPTSVRSQESIETTNTREGGEEATSPPVVVTSEDNEGEAPVVDAKEEERQRRAAIAARMARLGGARVGMAAPVFGKKPPVRRPTQDDVPPATEAPKAIDDGAAPRVSSPEVVKDDVTSPPISDAASTVSPSETSIPEDVHKSPEYFPARKNSESASVLSSQSVEAHAATTPTAMPIPVVPRRTGPPRKKPAKSVTSPPDDTQKAEEEPSVEAELIVSPPQGASKSPADEGKVEKLEQTIAAPMSPVTTPSPEAEELISTPEQGDSEPTASSPQIAMKLPGTESDNIIREEVPKVQSPEPKDEINDNSSVGEVRTENFAHEPSNVAYIPPAVTLSVAPLAEPLEHVDKILEAKASTLIEDEEDSVEEEDESKEDDKLAEEDAEDEDEAEEAARRKRAAERIVKMGGVNPFAPPPQPPVNVSPESPRSPPPTPAFAITSPTILATTSEEKQSDVLHSSVPAPAHNIHADPLSGPKTNEDLSDEGEGVDEDDDERIQYESAAPEQPKTPWQAASLVHSDSDEDPEVEAAQYSRSPPVPSVGTRPPVHTHQVPESEPKDDSDGSEYEDEIVETLAHPPAKPIDEAPAHQAFNLQHTSSPPGRPAQPPRRIIPQAPEPSEEEDEAEEETDEEADERLAQSQLFIPPPGRRSSGFSPPRRQFSRDGDDDGSENDAPALPVRQRQSVDSVPPPRSPSPASDYDAQPDSDHDGQALPIPPRNEAAHTSSSVTSSPPAHTQSTSQDKGSAPLRQLPPIRHTIPPSPTSPREFGDDDQSQLTSPTLLTPSFSLSGSEVLDEEEGDPIDPGFHSPSRKSSAVNLHAVAQAQAASSATRPSATAPTVSPPAKAPPVEEPKDETEEDSEQLRRKTIAERMAKLGGIRFGAAPMPTPATRPPPSREEQETSESAQDEVATEALSEEEEERARKERIAAKMANMGGMRIGMMPMGMGMGMGGMPTTTSSHIQRTESDAPKSPPLRPSAPPTRAIPPSRPTPQPTPAPPPPLAVDTDSEYGSAAASEDGVKVEAEESEPDEVDYEEAKIPEEAPPVPSRGARGIHRQGSSDKPASPIMTRPPVPTSIPNRRSSVQTTRSMTGTSTGDIVQSPTLRKSSGFMPPSQSEYVMVEEPESHDVPAPPPARPTSRVPPMRATPQLPQESSMKNISTDPSDSISSQWELPSIPVSTLDFGGEADLTLSWTDAAADRPAPASPPPPSPPPPAKKAAPPLESLSADALMALWGRVGVQVCEVATALFEKSKKTLIGDGTYAGFVQAVLSAVPNAASIPTPVGEYGYLVYMQNGPSVQKRASEIMPGDIVEIQDAKLKGHKGLQTYHQSVGGTGQVLVGVVGEFEAKKTKVRVFHANQHVGQQTVESVSYRLEDLKSGIVKVYRVLES